MQEIFVFIFVYRRELILRKWFRGMGNLRNGSIDVLL